ncbi:hypothetical protein, partial [Klebsiella pneumoniae]
MIRDGSKRYDTGINWFCVGSQKKLEDGFSLSFFPLSRSPEDNSRNMLKPVGQSVAQPQKIAPRR